MKETVMYLYRSSRIVGYRWQATFYRYNNYNNCSYRIVLLPKIGIMDWKFAQPNIDWGSIVMFGAGIGLGSVLLKTKAAT